VTLLEERAAGATSGTTGIEDTPATPWVVVARAGMLDEDARAAVLAALPERTAERFLIATCQRVEWYGSGPAAELAVLRARWPELDVLDGRHAIEHLLRLAAGLESAIVGEGQVLHQVRVALAGARADGPLTPELGRLVETAIRVGRRSRAGGSTRRTIATLALDRLALAPGARLLVVGAGAMGVLVAREAAVRGLSVELASRRTELAGRPARSLADAARSASRVDGIVIALAGTWDLDVSNVPTLPPVVDLSAPPALSDAIRRALGSRHVGIDELLATERLGPADTAYRVRAERLVDAGADGYEHWLAARDSLPVLRRLLDRSEAQRAADTAVLARRLDLDPDQLAIVERYSSQLVARLFHEPVARLGADPDGSAAAAARRLFER
jgi:glutamyl-tRNA reductase